MSLMDSTDLSPDTLQFHFLNNHALDLQFFFIQLAWLYGGEQLEC